MIRKFSLIAMLLTILVAAPFASAYCVARYRADSCQGQLLFTLTNGEKKCKKDLRTCNKYADKGRNWRHLRPATRQDCKEDSEVCYEANEELYNERVDRNVDEGKCCDWVKVAAGY